MYYYEKDYLMRLIHNISHALAYLSFGKKGETLPEVMGQEVRADNDYLLRMIDSGQINAAENRLFELIECPYCAKPLYWELPGSAEMKSGRGFMMPFG